MDKTLLKIFAILFRLLRVCLHYFLAIINGFRGKKVPPVTDPILLLSATELAKRIRERTLTSVSVVKAYTNRILEVEPFINATVDRRFEDALEEAKEADALVASGKMTTGQLEKEKPLLGVPFTVKILITVKGLRCTAGSLLFKDLRCQEDSVTVTQMKKAGAIVLASTNSSECGLNLQSSNYMHGTTRNPYDTSRTSGGSSGGESAIIGAAGSVIGLGNDLAGSVRIPSMFTGIFAHKPTRGLVSNVGCFPVPDPGLHRFLSTGPMCRYAEDLVTAMRILSTSDKAAEKFGKEVQFERLKVHYLCSIGENMVLVENVDSEIKDAVKRVASYFQKRGSKIEEVTIPLFKYSGLLFLHAMLSVVPDLSKTITAGKIKWNGLHEFIKLLTFRSLFTVGYVLALNVRNIPFFYNPAKTDFYKKLENKLDDQLNNLLDENSVLVMPTMPFPAPYNNEITILIGSSSYTSIFNVLGLPSTQCPVGLNKQGLPLGVQVVSRRGNDALTISCALELEKAFGGWKAP